MVERRKDNRVVLEQSRKEAEGFLRDLATVPLSQVPQVVRKGIDDACKRHVPESLRRLAGVHEGGKCQ